MLKKYFLLLLVATVFAGGVMTVSEVDAQVSSSQISRGRFVKNMYRKFVGKTRTRAASCFTDVRSSNVNAPYICAAYEKKFFNGYADGAFKPAQPIRLAEALAMTYTASGFQPLSKATSGAWYKPYAEFAHINGIISAYAILPDSFLSNSQASQIINAFYKIKTGEEKLAIMRQNFSAGCGKTPPNPALTQINVGGVERSFITSVPWTYEKNTPIKLVFAFHGRTNSNSMVKGYYRAEEMSNGEAIFVYPGGLKNKSGFSWSDPGDPPNNLRDFALFDALLEEFSNSYCVDLDHVYVVGHSLGAWFTNSLACARGDRIRAIGSVGGGTTKGACTGPVAAMVWHNPKDNLVPFSDGEKARDQLRDQNECSNKTQPVSPRAASCVAYTGCAKDAPLLWCPHTEDTDYRGAYYPHTWPSSAGSEIWKFFKSLD